ncbi:MAG: hypothetical protein ACOC3Z_03645 [Nanoarchaeota archaeon]
MKKEVKNIFLIIGTILFMNFISAYDYSDYTRFSLNNFSGDTLSVISLGLVFIIFFTMINYAVSKRLPKGVSSIISFCLSALVIFGTLKAGWDISGYLTSSLFSIGLDESTFYVIATIVFILILIQLIRKIGLGKLLFFTGLILLTITLFTDLIYSKGFASIISIILIILGSWLWIKKSKSTTSESYKKSKAEKDEERLRRYKAKQELKNRKRKATEENARRWTEFGLKTGYNAYKTGKFVKNKFKNKKKEKAHEEALRENEIRKQEKQRKKKEKAQKQAEKKQLLIEDKKWRDKKEKEKAEAQRIAQIKAQKEEKEKEKQQRIANRKAERERIRQERKENNEKIKKREKEKKELIKKIQSKEAELKKWRENYERRKNNPKKEHKIKNHVLRLEREFNELKAQLENYK